MARLMKKNLPFIKEEVPAEEARKRILELNEPFKEEILDMILQRDPTAKITIYHIGEPGGKLHWWDLCAGPHVASTGDIDNSAFSVDSISSCYWRADENNPELIRVRGTAWETPQQLEYHQYVLDEAAKRDHRKLGQELDLFSLAPNMAGPGLVFWHPKGSIVREEIESFLKQSWRQWGYDVVYTPHVAKLDLWKTSGHHDFYADSMFRPMDVEDVTYQLRPMNCPFHVTMYKQQPRTYRQLPIKWAELGTVYRYEEQHNLNGLFRVRGFTQDDGHIFCQPGQIKDEIKQVLGLIQGTLTTFGFRQYEVNLSTRPDKSVGSDALWQRAEDALVDALGELGWEYSVDAGGGAFYGPKIDIKIKDAIGRQWQCSTVQLDFNLPQRFDMTYINPDNEEEQVIMIHRAVLGSIERFFGILIENFAGAFPLWLAPVQVKILPIVEKDDIIEYCEGIRHKLKQHNVRVEIARGERFKKMIRNSETEKIPLMLVVGNQEREAGRVAVRTYKAGDLGVADVDEVVDKVAACVRDKCDYA